MRAWKTSEGGNKERIDKIHVLAVKVFVPYRAAAQKSQVREAKKKTSKLKDRKEEEEDEEEETEEEREEEEEEEAVGNKKIKKEIEIRFYR